MTYFFVLSAVLLCSSAGMRIGIEAEMAANAQVAASGNISEAASGNASQEQNLEGTYSGNLDQELAVRSFTTAALTSVQAGATMELDASTVITLGRDGKVLGYSSTALEDPRQNDQDQAFHLYVAHGSCVESGSPSGCAGNNDAWSTSGPVVSGDLIVWYNVKTTKVIDCSFQSPSGCSHQPYPLPNGHTGSPRFIHKVEDVCTGSGWCTGQKATIGSTIRLGDHVIFERVSRYDDGHRLVNCWPNCGGPRGMYTGNLDQELTVRSFTTTTATYGNHGNPGVTYTTLYANHIISTNTLCGYKIFGDNYANGQCTGDVNTRVSLCDRQGCLDSGINSVGDCATKVAGVRSLCSSTFATNQGPWDGVNDVIISCSCVPAGVPVLRKTECSAEISLCPWSSGNVYQLEEEIILVGDGTTGYAGQGARGTNGGTRRFEAQAPRRRRAPIWNWRGW